MQYLALKNLDRFDTYTDVEGVYARGRYGQYDVSFSDFERKEATPEIEALIKEFCKKYELMERCTEWEFAEDNDELGTGSSTTYYEYSEIGAACIFLLFEGKIVGVAYPERSHMPVAWFHEDAPGYCACGSYSFHAKK